ncbi:hypothetical protein DFH06DRAFT_1468468 [Mycena polygramma]|nr:hypothetical protein DFH06DRAFT_1468468 [Mycena polygramma]
MWGVDLPDLAKPPGELRCVTPRDIDAPSARTQCLHYLTPSLRVCFSTGRSRSGCSVRPPWRTKNTIDTPTLSASTLVYPEEPLARYRVPSLPSCESAADEGQEDVWQDDDEYYTTEASSFIITHPHRTAPTRALLPRFACAQRFDGARCSPRICRHLSRLNRVAFAISHHVYHRLRVASTPTQRTPVPTDALGDDADYVYAPPLISQTPSPSGNSSSSAARSPPLPTTQRFLSLPESEDEGDGEWEDLRSRAGTAVAPDTLHSWWSASTHAPPRSRIPRDAVHARAPLALVCVYPGAAHPLTPPPPNLQIPRDAAHHRAPISLPAPSAPIGAPPTFALRLRWPSSTRPPRAVKALVRIPQDLSFCAALLPQITLQVCFFHPQGPDVQCDDHALPAPGLVRKNNEKLTVADVNVLVACPSPSASILASACTSPDVFATLAPQTPMTPMTPYTQPAAPGVDVFECEWVVVLVVVPGTFVVVLLLPGPLLALLARLGVGAQRVQRGECGERVEEEADSGGDVFAVAASLVLTLFFLLSRFSRTFRFLFVIRL